MLARPWVLSPPAHVCCPRLPRTHTSTLGSRVSHVVRNSIPHSGAFEPPSQIQELQNSGLDGAAASSSDGGQRYGDQQSELASREQQLWQRQEVLWQQQLEHWQHERNTFIQREAALLAHIQQLHSHLTMLATQHMQSSCTGSNATSAIGIIEPVTASGEDRQASLAVTEMLANAILADRKTQTAAAAEERSAAQYSAPPLQGVLPTEPAPVASVAEHQASSAAPAVQTPSGPPPTLSIGCDDIYWVHQLQSALMTEGYYCGEEEIEDFLFESGTESAVLAFQACAGLEESGVADEPTWRALLGSKYQPTSPPVDEEILEETEGIDGPLPNPGAPSTPKQGSQAKDAHPWEASWGDLLSSQDSDTEFDRDSSRASSSSSSDAGSSDHGASAASSSLQSDDMSQTPGAEPSWKPYVNQHADYSKWAVLREGDGGRHVHELQVALAQKGFWPGEDDMLWWQFGDMTCSAVQTFQATANLPESGVVTSDTWQALLGPNAKPIDAKNLASNDANDEDMTAEHDGVYLVGEQRWSRRPKSS